MKPSTFDTGIRYFELVFEELLMRFVLVMAFVTCCLLVTTDASSEDSSPNRRSYANRLTPIENPKPLLADHPGILRTNH